MPIGAQDPVDASGTIVGAGNLAVQAEQVLENLEIALQERTKEKRWRRRQRSAAHPRNRLPT